MPKMKSPCPSASSWPAQPVVMQCHATIVVADRVHDGDWINHQIPKIQFDVNELGSSAKWRHPPAVGIHRKFPINLVRRRGYLGRKLATEVNAARICMGFK